MTTTGAWVVYDIYWDPHGSYATEDDAKAACAPEAEHPGCHPLFDPVGTPGALADDNYGHWDDFQRDVLGRADGD